MCIRDRYTVLHCFLFITTFFIYWPKYSSLYFFSNSSSRFSLPLLRPMFLEHTIPLRKLVFCKQGSVITDKNSLELNSLCDLQLALFSKNKSSLHFLFCSIGSVSYTHLDVYKRQARELRKS